MTAPIRVLLCDDSALIRRLIKTALQTDPGIKVVCEARNGRDALDKLFDAKPDVVLMDVEMPVMDGIDAVREIRKFTRKLPVIMFSALTSRSAEATLDAIDSGATDFASKPASAGHINKAIEHVQQELIPKIYRWTKRSPGAAAEPPSPAQRPAAPVAHPDTAGANAAGRSSGNPNSGAPVSAIAIGVSTGGPQALKQLVAALPLNFPAPILIVQHMPPVFTRRLAERLAAEKGHPVREATDGEELRKGEILVAPGDHHLLAVRDKTAVRARLVQSAPENSCRPAVDPLFRSVAKAYGHLGLGVILTGMGKDGTEGARALRKTGARVIAQDERTSVVWGMPGNVVDSGLADEVLPLEQIAQELVRTTQRRQVVRV